jgi:uncharacterized protein (DUF427 family)
VRVEVDGEVVAETTRARLLCETQYEEPLPDAVKIAGLVAVWDEQVDIFVDGERRGRPGGALSEALEDEFGAS